MSPPEKEQFSTEIVNGGAENSGPIPKAAGSFYVSVKVKSSLPDFLNTVNLKYVKLGYGYLLSHSFYFLVVPIAAVIFSGATAKVRKQMIMWEDAAILTCDFIDVVLIMGILGFVLYICVGLTPRSTYLVDFACYRPPNELKVSKDEFIDLATKSGNFNKEAIEFQKQILNDSGIGDETYMPASIFKPGYQITLRDGREEAAMAMFGAINDLFKKTKIRPKDIKILVVNCGVLNTTPSLSSMVVNHFKMRNDIQSFNLGGMGCSAGMIAIDLANDLLSAYKGSYGIVVSTEAVTYTWYKGNDLDLLIPNCFFRMGAAALLLSNGRRDWWRAKYQLKQLVRTHKGMDDTSFKCIRLREDTSGRQGISVSKEVIEVGINALKDNIASLSHLLHNTHISVSKRLYFSLFNNNNKNEKTKLRINPVSGCEVSVDHVCILAASKTVLDEVKKQFGIREEWMEASRKTLERFGNTSSSSVWYELAYLEANGKVKRKDSILQIAFGSGFKCNSLVLEALKTPRKLQMNPWV